MDVKQQAVASHPSVPFFSPAFSSLLKMLKFNILKNLSYF